MAAAMLATRVPWPFASIAGSAPKADHPAATLISPSSEDTPVSRTAIRAEPTDGGRWQALAGWLRNTGREDEAAALRVFWPALRDSLLAGRTLDFALEYVRKNAVRLGQRARDFEQRSGQGS